MKSFNTATALIIAVTLITGVTGCKKTPKNPTFIPAGPTRNPGEDPTASRLGGPVGGNRTGVPPGGTNTLTGVDGTPINPGTNPDGSPTGRNIDPNAVTGLTTRPPEDSIEDDKIFANERIFFDYDKTSVKGSERSKIERVATYLKNEVSVSLRVEGNCDERGTEEYNRSLGERRALAVREYLVNLGIAPERVTTVSFGEDKPADPGHDETAWAQNRRGDFVVLRPKPLQ